MGAGIDIWSHFGRSKNVPQSIAICPGATISYLGIIKTPKKRRIMLKKPKTEKSLNSFAVFWGLAAAPTSQVGDAPRSPRPPIHGLGLPFAHTSRHFFQPLACLFIHRH